MSKKDSVRTITQKGKLHELIQSHQAAIQAQSSPIELAAAMLRVFHQIHASNDRMKALEDYLFHDSNRSMRENLRAFFLQKDLETQPHNAYLQLVRKAVLENILQPLAPGAVFELHLNDYPTLRHAIKLHRFVVGVQGIYELKDDPWDVGTLGIDSEHFTALNEVLGLIFDHPLQLHLKQPHLGAPEALQIAMEKQAQVILQSLYRLEHDSEYPLSPGAPLAALLVIAEALTLYMEEEIPHLPPLDNITLLRMYLHSATSGNAHKTLTERLQQAAHSHPEHYRIALNRMIREVFRQHFLIEMDDQFQVTVLMPDEQGRYKVKVDAPIFSKLRKQHALTDKHLKALTWMLESIFNYAEELELPNNVWRREVMA